MCGFGYVVLDCFLFFGRSKQCIDRSYIQENTQHIQICPINFKDNNMNKINGVNIIDAFYICNLLMSFQYKYYN